MATWKEKFEELSEENGHQTALWGAGVRNHSQLRAAMEALSEFIRQYEVAGEPDRDTEMP